MLPDMRLQGILLSSAIVALAGEARADVLLPDPCEGKRDGDACRTAIDRLPGLCVASTARRPDGRPALGCLTEGERSPPKQKHDDPPLRPAEPEPARGCRVDNHHTPPLLLLAPLLLARRRRPLPR